MNRVMHLRATHACGIGLSLLVGLGCQEEQAPPVESPTAHAPVAVAATAGALAPPWAERRVEGSGFPCPVEEVLRASCRRCHWEPRENDAPFSLVKWEDTQKVRTGKPIHKLMKQMVEANLMPPLDALVEPAVIPLTADQKQTILTWLGAGATRSNDVCGK